MVSDFGRAEPTEGDNVETPAEGLVDWLQLAWKFGGLVGIVHEIRAAGDDRLAPGAGENTPRGVEFLTIAAHHESVRAGREQRCDGREDVRLFDISGNAIGRGTALGLGKGQAVLVIRWSAPACSCSWLIASIRASLADVCASLMSDSRPDADNEIAERDNNPTAMVVSKTIIISAETSAKPDLMVARRIRINARANSVLSEIMDLGLDKSATLPETVRMHQ